MNVLKPASVIDLARQLIPLYVSERARTDALDAWARGEQELIKLPRKATAEHRQLAELARTPLVPLVITNTAQGLFVDGYKSESDSESHASWQTWLANDLDMRQAALHRGALSHSLAYATVTPGRDFDGPRSVIRGVSARKMVAVYQDVAEDDWPMYAMRVDTSGAKRMLRLIDEEAVYFVGASQDFSELEFIEPRTHGAGVCPVVRYANLLDLEGRASSEVEPLIKVASRYDKTVYDRLLVQHYNSWKVRTIAGLQEFADNEATADAKKLKLAQDDILVAEDPDTKFGTLDETPLEGFIRAADSDLDTLSGIGQVPGTIFGSSKLANLSADTIAELRAGLAQKLFERQVSFGKSHSQALSLAHLIDTGEDAPVTARVTWRDMQPRTIGQVVDALGKAVQMLEVPPEAVWHLIPGMSRTDVDEWRDQRDLSEARRAREQVAQAAAAARANPTVAAMNATA